MKAIRWLGNQNYGSVYVNFGNLFSTRSILQRCSTSSPTIDSPFSEIVQELAVDVILDHQKNLVVPIFAGVSLLILSKVGVGGLSTYQFIFPSRVVARNCSPIAY
jgi:glycerol-3-phosphate O-acyltransferase